MFKDTLSGSIGPSTFNIGTNGDDCLLLRFFFFTVMKETFRQVYRKLDPE
jgi:hypothetical protein